MSQDKVFMGYFEPLKKWNDSTKKYEDIDLNNISRSGRFNFTLAELEDMKKYATNPKDADKQPRVYFELKTSKKGTLYAEVNDPATWTSKPQQTAVSASNDLPF